MKIPGSILQAVVKRAKERLEIHECNEADNLLKEGLNNL